MNNLEIKIKNGFTLIELIITLGIFLILISIAIGGFINALRGQRVAVGLMEINDNMGLVLEQMAREIRTGYDFIPASGELQFRNVKGKAVSYKLNNNIIEKGEGPDFASLIFTPIIAENVKIVDFNIYACGENLDSTLLNDCPSPSNTQPKITLSLKITGKGKDKYIEKLGIYNDIQTTISSRQYPSL